LSDPRIEVPIIEIIAIERGGVCHNSSYHSGKSPTRQH
jgi:hypothetical protein